MVCLTRQMTWLLLVRVQPPALVLVSLQASVMFAQDTRLHAAVGILAACSSSFVQSVAIMKPSGHIGKGMKGTFMAPKVASAWKQVAMINWFYPFFISSYPFPRFISVNPSAHSVWCRISSWNKDLDMNGGHDQPQLKPNNELGCEATTKAPTIKYNTIYIMGHHYFC